jgi:hypothetical protein
MQRIVRFGAFALFATAVSGCCVLPYGPPRGRGYGYGDEGAAPQRHAPHGDGRPYDRQPYGG